MMLKDAHKLTMFAVRGAVSLASRPMRRVVPRSCRVRAQSGCPGGIVCRGPRAWADNVVVRYLVQQYLSFRRTRFVSYFVRDTCRRLAVCTCTANPPVRRAISLGLRAKPVIVDRHFYSTSSPCPSCPDAHT